MIKKINYGVDAPKFIRNLFLFAVIFYCIAVFFFKIKAVLFFCSIIGSVSFIEGILMILYAKIGKFRQRQRMLNLINWTGNESVLDVG